MNLEEAKKYVEDTNKKIRQLELDKAKTEERKKLNDAALENCINKMKEAGCTPETIQSVIDSKTQQLNVIKTKIDAVLSGVENEL